MAVVKYDIIAVGTFPAGNEEADGMGRERGEIGLIREML